MALEDKIKDMLQQTQQPQQQAEPSPPKPAVIDGEDIPEAFRGKPVKEVIDQLLSTSTELEKLKSEMAQKEAALLQELEKSRQVAQPKTEEELKREREREFFTDPISFLEKHHSERLAPIVNQYLEDQAKLQREFARQRIGEREFRKFEKRIDELIQGVPLAQRARPETWDIAYTVALGEEARKSIVERAAKEGYYVEAETLAPKEKEKKPELSEEERKVAARFGMTDEEYIKWKETTSI